MEHSSSRQVCRISFKNQHFHSSRPAKEQVTPHLNANFTTLQSVPHSPYKQYNTQAPQINCFRVPSHASCQEDFWCQVTRGPA